MSESRRALRDVAIVLAAIGAAWLLSRFVLYPMLGVPENAPLILRPILGFAAAWTLVRAAGGSWSDFGLRRPDNLALALGATIALYGLVWLVSRYAVPVIAGLFTVTPSPPFLAYIRGSAVAFAGWIAISWIVGGFMEELLFRGYLMQRVAKAAGGGVAGHAAGAIAQAVLFGLLHLHQGAFGFFFAGTIALLYGAAFHLLGRNLWPLILVHGAWNSIAVARLYGL
ncbi:MAG TPA: type II CAAX endopeptidase family protein [Usitatibacteraceae bacterium]|nr:type II CAAX endopeptidase family protein [Usitatibacteraceae bacterium]